MADNSALTAVENKIPYVSGLVKKKKKTDYKTKICEIEKKITNHHHDKYITTPEFNNIKTPNTSNNFLNPLLDYVNTKIRAKFCESCLKQDKATHNHGTIVNIDIVYEISKNYSISSYPTSENCFFFGAVSLTKHIDINQYKYSGYGTRFDRKWEFSFGSNGFGRNVIFFGADMSSSVHVDNKTKNISVLGKEIVQGLENTKIYAEKCIQLILLKIIKNSA